MDWYVYCLRKMMFKRMKEKKIAVVDSNFCQGLEQIIKNNWNGGHLYDCLANKDYYTGSAVNSIHFNEALEAIFPCNLDNRHWIFIRLDLLNEIVHVYNSVNDPNIGERIKHICDSMPRLHKFCSYHEVNNTGYEGKSSWEVQLHLDVPQQKPGSGDCGIFVLKWMEFYLNDVSLMKMGKLDTRTLRREMSTVVFRTAWEETESNSHTVVK